MTVFITSGYFSLLHVGHVRYLQASRSIADRLIVIVNNDVQQTLKKGYIIVPEKERLFVVEALRCVDEVVLSIDEDRSVVKTLEMIAEEYKGEHIVFANGGDRRDPTDIPEAEICRRLGIEMLFGIGGDDKANSTSDIEERVRQKA